MPVSFSFFRHAQSGGSAILPSKFGALRLFSDGKADCSLYARSAGSGAAVGSRNLVARLAVPV
jgi:hypothetical protein